MVDSHNVISTAHFDPKTEKKILIAEKHQIKKNWPTKMSGYNPLGEQTNLSTQEVQSDPQAGPVTCATSSDHNQEIEGQGRKTLPIVSLYMCSPHFSCLSTPLPETTREVYDNELTFD